MPTPSDPAEHLLAVSGVKRPAVVQRGALSGRQGASGEAVDISNGSENLSGETSQSPPAAPMEATLVAVATAAPARSVPSAVANGSGSVWDELARCESGGNWAIDSGNVVAERLRAARGYATWPSCRAKLGLP